MSFQYNKNSSVFDNNLYKLKELIKNIRNNILTLEGHLTSLQTNQPVSLINKIHKLEDEANDFVGTALTTFRNLSANYDPKNSLQKSRHDEIKNEFRSTAQELHTLQKKIANNLRKENDKMLDWKDDDETTKLLDNPNLQKSAAFIEEDEAQLRKLNQEDETIRNIEKDMIDINQVFRDLNNIIHEQGENIDTIESNIEMTEQHVQKADKDLTQGLRHKQKARKNKLICFIIIFIVIVIFSIILYFTFK